MKAIAHVFIALLLSTSVLAVASAPVEQYEDDEPVIQVQTNETNASNDTNVSNNTIAEPKSEITASVVSEQPVEEEIQDEPELAVVEQAKQKTTATMERKPLVERKIIRKKPLTEKPAYWFLVAVGIGLIGSLLYFALPRWLEKRKKGFGF
jgi:hypothetical protein